MTHIFLDESGDLGFSKGSSKWFLFTIAIVENPRTLEKIVKKIWKSLKKKHKNLGELHAFNEKPITRKRLLKCVAQIKDLVDFVSWAIFRKYERGDYEYYEIIKDKIIEEKLLFP